MIISVIRLVHWWYQGKYIFAKALAFRSSSFPPGLQWSTVTSCLHSLGQPQAEGQCSGIIFKAIHRESLFFFFFKHFSTAAVKNSLDWLNCYKGNYTSGQNLFDLPEVSMLCYSRKADACDTGADGTLFCCSPWFGIHIVSSVRTLFLYVALSSIPDLYMCYGYITIYILPLQRNSMIKCSVAFCALGHP